MADILLFRNMYMKTSRMFCYVKFVQHTETDNIQTNVKLLELYVSTVKCQAVNVKL